MPELHLAEVKILTLVQKRHHSSELTWQRTQRVSPQSKLYRLEPQLDEQGLVHIQGHTIHQDLGKDELSPILLPAVDHVTVLIIYDIHKGVAGHSGRERTLACLRERYWVVAWRTEIDCVLCNCFVCHKVTSKPIKQRQGDLLVEQITLGKPPLLAMGLTVLGHSVSLRQSNEEIWLSLYVFHLQSSTYKTSFSRYRCFPQCSNQVFCTTGTPEKIISDNGTTFARANKELQEAFASWGTGSSLDKLLQRKGIKWGFSHLQLCI
ncbi:uncharacterized protein [Penaeus vannamei]|uniref:uncharacterized protein n=1 Tax=Penaeus vannamei TaxID=6689 RepID=UPI00387F9BCC